MTHARKLGGSLVLAAFLASVASAAGFTWPDCCSPACESCPIVYCSVTPATAPQKVDVAHVAPPAVFELELSPTSTALVLAVSQIPTFLSHEFHRPMRN